MQSWNEGFQEATAMHPLLKMLDAADSIRNQWDLLALDHEPVGGGAL